MTKTERLFLIFKGDTLCCIEDKPELAARKAKEYDANVILQCRVEVMYRNDDSLDWTHSLRNPDQ